MKNNSIYVLILNYQSYLDTIEYVKNIQQQQQLALNILIVDNCSPNNSFSILQNAFSENKYVKVIQSEKNGGYAYGNNYGLRYLESIKVDYILISNNDIKIKDPLLLYKMVGEYKRLKDPAFISPMMYVNDIQSTVPAWKIPTYKEDIAGSLRIFKMFNHITTYNLNIKNNALKVDCLPGSFFMSKKEIFYDIGLMDENTFLYMEEAILAYKVKQHRLNNYLLLNMQYEHMTAQTISNELSSVKMRKHLIDSRLYFHKEYLKTNFIGRSILQLLFHAWKVETFLIGFIQKTRNH